MNILASTTRRFRSLPALGMALAIAAGWAPGLATSSNAADTYEIDGAHSTVGFKVGHFVGKVSGRFNTFSGTIVHDAADPTKSSVNATIQVPSIDTANEKRDGHLKNPDFFDVEKFPVITFTSKSVKPTGEKTADVVGDLTMHGVTKEITLPVELLGVMPTGEGDQKRSAWTASLKINRRDFGLTWGKMVEGVAAVGDVVEIQLDIESLTPAPPKP